MENVVRGVVEQAGEIEAVVIDLTEVTEIDLAAGRLLAGLASWMEEEGRALVFVAPPHSHVLAELPGDGARVFPDRDVATEWCEDLLLAAHAAPSAQGGPVALAEHRLTAGFEAPMLADLEQLLRSRPFAAGETIFAAGDPADAIFLLVAGEVTVEVEVGDGRRRLATLTPGLAFGEVALAGVPVRPVSVRGDCDGECLALSVADFDRLSAHHPDLQAALMRNLLASFYETIGRMSREVGVHFDG